jgi:protein TonB
VSLEIAFPSQEDAMFADSLCESRWGSQSHRGWITVASLAVQTLAIAVSLALPLLHTEGLPRMHSTVEPILPAPRAAASAIRRITNHPNHTAITALIVMKPNTRQTKLVTAQNLEPPVDVNRLAIGEGTSNRGSENPILNSIANSVSNFALAPTTTRQAPRVSRMMEGDLIQRVQPLYPPLAKQAHIQGRVILRAVISRNGMIENLEVLSGHPMLVQAAIDAVKQWRYRPYSLNGEPVEVETQVTVNFVLSGG